MYMFFSHQTFNLSCISFFLADEQLLKEAGMPSSVVYGAMDQEARSIHLDKFRKGKVKPFCRVVAHPAVRSSIFGPLFCFSAFFFLLSILHTQYVCFVWYFHEVFFVQKFCVVVMSSCTGHTYMSDKILFLGVKKYFVCTAAFSCLLAFAADAWCLIVLVRVSPLHAQP